LKVISHIEANSFNFIFLFGQKKKQKKATTRTKSFEILLLGTALIQLFKWFRAARGLPRTRTAFSLIQKDVCQENVGAC